MDTQHGGARPQVPSASERQRARTTRGTRKLNDPEITHGPWPRLESEEQLTSPGGTVKLQQPRWHTVSRALDVSTSGRRKEGS
jgi:hypothetical protein